MVNVEAAPGRGWLAHRAGALLWSPGETRPDALLAAFLGARDAGSTRDAVTAAVIDADLDVAAFALVTWAPHLHVVVMGAVDVETDAPSLPSLSGATSRTWVEHGVPGAAGSVVVAAGGAPDAGTAVGPGVVRAGGFRLTTAAERIVEQPAPEPEPEPEPEPPQPVAAASGGAALLDLVTGGDWMDDSIGLAAPGSLLDEPAATEPEPAPEPEPIAGPTVSGRRCPSGHANPPTSATCQRCGDLVDLATPIVDVPQPVLADLAGDDGTTMAIRGPIIVGRNPDPAAAGLDDDAERLALPERAGVSRTHVVVSADGWTITATDCGSRRGTELARPGAALVRLEPWTSHEVQVGDELLLGGPTTIRLVEPSTGDSSPSSS
jgi:hypothetical protein